MKKELQPLLKRFLVFAKNQLNFKNPPRLFLRQDTKNQRCILGKTAHYDPGKQSVTLYISGRHPKDVLRSFAHELVHHCQNERGDLHPDKMKTINKNYAQENPHMRKMEKEAYLMGNMCFRDWEDSLDNKSEFQMKLAEQKFLKENKKMSVKISKKVLKSLIEKLLKEQLDSPVAVRAKAAADAKNRKGEPKPAKKKKPKQYRPQGPGPGRCAIDDDDCNIAEEQQDVDLDEGTCSGKKQGSDDSKPKKKDCAGSKCPGCSECKPGLKKENEELEEKLGDGKTQGSDSVAARLDKDSNFTGQDFAAEKGGKRGPGYGKKGDDESEQEKQEESKIQTPEQENTLYESRFTQRNTRLFEKLLKEWTK